MKNLVNEIREKYNVDGENEKYLEEFNNFNELGDFKEKVKNSLNVGQTLRSLKYPVLFFDDSNSDSGQVYESDEDPEYILKMAGEYFERKK